MEENSPSIRSPGGYETSPTGGVINHPLIIPPLPGREDRARLCRADLFDFPQIFPVDLSINGGDAVTFT
jgi:hypothetical protein